jgi:DNA-binding YbaB/EbfC family protein
MIQHSVLTLQNRRLEMSRGMGNLMKQAQMMQEKLLRIQEELAEKTMEATAGGGMVTVSANGKSEIVSIKIEPDVVDPEDVEMLQDLVIAAANEALRKVQAMAQEEMGKVTGGLKIPGLM